MEIIRVVESESVESHVFRWSRSRFSKLLDSESVFKTAGVGIGFSKLLESESENLLQLATDSNVYLII